MSYHHSTLFVIDHEEQGFIDHICPSELDISTQAKEK